MILSASFSEENKLFNVQMVEESLNFSTEFADTNIITIKVPTPGADVEIYSGEYTVVPKISAQTLFTANKFLNDNMTIRSIPYYEVLNNSGGDTVYIGTEIEFNYS